MNLHPTLAAALATDFATALASPPQLTQDALVLRLTNGVTLTVRYAAADAYSLRWQLGTAEPATEPATELAIDTAPCHPELATRPNHLHLADGRVVADPLTRTDAAPADNVAAVLRALLQDPLLSAVAP